MSDTKKAIHYFSSAAEQNHPEALFYLGVIYINNNINIAIHYFTLAANQNYPEAQFNLGIIYSSKKYVKQDIDLAIHYFTLAANQNYTQAQFNLGMIYYCHNYHRYDIKKSLYYIILASKNNNRYANFAHGYLLHEGKNLERNIQEAIHYYKESSSFNNQYAKNNLGILYKNGYGDEIEQKISNAILYFEEAIKQKNDYLSMYNLAHIYMYNDRFDKDHKKMNELLIKSSYKFIHSLILLCLSLIKQFDFNVDAIILEIKQIEGNECDSLPKVLNSIDELSLLNKSKFEYFYEFYRKQDYLYNINLKPIPSYYIESIKTNKNPPIHPYLNDISAEFYNGFGIDLL